MAWVLAVDFGTTNTVASVADASGVRTLTVNGRPVMASAVFLHDDGWYVGDAAIRMARHRLDRFEPCPKRAIPDGTLFLGGADVPVTDAITALFRPLLSEALEQHNGQPPSVFVVTHPATWTASRIDVLLHAAFAAAPGKIPWPQPTALAEPVAAAQHVLRIENMPASARMVVLDLGGGTTDVTVVDRHGDSLAVVGNPVGRDGLGGVDFDLRLARWMVAEVDAAGLYDRLAGSHDPELRERAVDIREHAREVKEQLSQQSVVPAQLPKSPPDLMEHTPVQVNRAVLEDLIRGSEQEPGLEQAVQLVNDSLAIAPPGPEMAGVFLVGGSSRIPLLGQLVTQRTGRVPISQGDPTTAVADGAARYGWGVLHAEPPTEMIKPVNEPAFRRTRTKVLLLAVLLLLLTSGGVFTYMQVSDSSSDSSPGTYTPVYDTTTTTTDTFTTTSDTTTETTTTTSEEETTTTTSEEETTTTTSDEPELSSYGKAVGPIGVFSEPCMCSSVEYSLDPGDVVEILCTIQGEPVQNTGSGQVSTLWNGVDGGYVPDVMLYTGTDQPTMPPC
jgi:molecular chaperone DnaK